MVTKSLNVSRATRALRPSPWSFSRHRPRSATSCALTRWAPTVTSSNRSTSSNSRNRSATSGNIGSRSIIRRAAKDDGAQAIGTILDPKGKATAAIAKGESYFGEADILGKPYVTGYEPIRDASSNVIGVYDVGYLKNYQAAEKPVSGDVFLV